MSYKGIPYDIRSSKNSPAYTKDELVEIAKSKGIKGSSSMTKNEIGEVLNIVDKLKKSRSPKNSPIGIEHMPIEIVSEILKHLGPQERRKVAAVSKQFEKVAKSEFVKKYGKKSTKKPLFIEFKGRTLNIEIPKYKLNLPYSSSSVDYYSDNINELKVGTFGTYFDGNFHYFRVSNIKLPDTIEIEIYKIKNIDKMIKYYYENEHLPRLGDNPDITTTVKITDYDFIVDRKVTLYFKKGKRYTGWNEVINNKVSTVQYRLFWSFLQLQIYRPNFLSHFK